MKRIKKYFVFQDKDGFFIGEDGSAIVKKITKDQFLQLRLIYEERGLPDEEDSNDNNDSFFSTLWM